MSHTEGGKRQNAKLWKILSLIISRWGTPRFLLMNNDTEFVNKTYEHSPQNMILVT